MGRSTTPRGMGFAVSSAAFLVVCLAAIDQAGWLGAAPPPPAAAPAGAPPSPMGDPARGAALYAMHCAGCHGAEGRGDGVAAEFLIPRPRDFTASEFRIVSAAGGLPTSEDLLRVITEGMPGSAMPSWGFLSEEDRLALVAYVKTLVRYFDEDAEEWVNLYEERGEPIAPAFETPAPSPERIARGRMLFVRAGCTDCHGVSGRGDGPTAGTNLDAAGAPIFPRDLTEGVFKGGDRPEDVFRRITFGVGPMPGNETSLPVGERWDLTHYVLSLSNRSAQDLAAQRNRHLRAPRAVGPIPADPCDPFWDVQEPTYLPLMPLWWRRGERVGGVLVRAVHDGTDLALHLRWEDATENAEAVRPQEFRDGAAVQWALEEGVPFLAMGDARAKVNLWFWRSDRQGGPDRYPDVQGTYPNRVVDDYPGLRDWHPGEGFGAQDRPAREHDPRFLTGWGAQNPVSDPEAACPVESLEAQGPSTVSTRAPRAQVIGGAGRWEKGAWSVLFRRPLRAGRGEVDLSPGRRVPVAFAAFDGARADRDGQKSITVWHDLEVER
ncbi:MAG: c-type cytochrome [Planctomycetes bacterium]|nr:c-type cytochrome [Planctomycetota bacterium]